MTYLHREEEVERDREGLGMPRLQRDNQLIDEVLHDQTDHYNGVSSHSSQYHEESKK